MQNLEQTLITLSRATYQKPLGELSTTELHTVVSRAVMESIADNFYNSQKKHNSSRRAYYLSAEFLVGRAIYNNMFCSGLTQNLSEILQEMRIILLSCHVCMRRYSYRMMGKRIKKS